MLESVLVTYIIKSFAFPHELESVCQFLSKLKKKKKLSAGIDWNYADSGDQAVDPGTFTLTPTPSCLPASLTQLTADSSA